MSHYEYSVRNTLRARAEAVCRDLPEDPEPATGDKFMCHNCERVFGQNDEITKIIVCRGCIVGIEAERLWNSDEVK